MLGGRVLILVLCATCCHVALSFKDGLLANGNFEWGPKPSQMKGTEVIDKTAIPNWQISGFVEYIKSGQKQGGMIIIVPEGGYAVRLGNQAVISQKVQVQPYAFYSITFNAARTCGDDNVLNVTVFPNSESKDWGMVPIQTMYSYTGWDSYSWAFVAETSEIDICFHNPGADQKHAACGPVVDSVALKLLYPPQRTRGNMLKNGNFEEGPYIFPNTSWGVLVPPNIEDDHSPLPGWIIESLKAVKYIDSDHFSVPEGKRAVELVAGRESVIAQLVKTIPNKDYVLTFAVGDANNLCEGSMMVEAFAGKVNVQVPYESKGRGGYTRAQIPFTAVAARTRIRFFSTYYTMRNDNSGTLCGPVIDDVRLVGVRKPGPAHAGHS